MLSNFASLLLDYIDIPCFVDFLLQCWGLKKTPEQNCVSSALRYGSECRSLAFPLCFQLRGFSSLHLIFSRIRLKTNLKGLRLFFPFSKGFMSQNANIKDSLVSSSPLPTGLHGGPGICQRGTLQSGLPAELRRGCLPQSRATRLRSQSTRPSDASLA